MEKDVLQLYLNLVESGEYDEEKKYANFIQTLMKQAGADKPTDEELNEIKKAWIGRMQKIGRFV